MTPFSSVAMIEKLALLRIAFCRAPVLSSASCRRTSAITFAVPASPSRAVSGSVTLVDKPNLREPSREPSGRPWYEGAGILLSSKNAATSLRPESRVQGLGERSLRGFGGDTLCRLCPGRSPLDHVDGADDGGDPESTNCTRVGRV